MKRSRQLPLFRRPGGLVVDLFAGGGGASVGLEAALGRPVDIAINHSAVALAVHCANHPETRHLTADIWEVRPREATGGRPVDVLWASPDCFPAGTLVLTKSGYRPIEEIAVGDEVLTHRNRWRRVTATMSGEKPTVVVRAHGHPGLECSSGHKFWARNQKRGEPSWIEASDLGRGSYCAVPRFAESAAPPSLPPQSEAPSFWWMVGRYLADGWADPQKGLVLTVGAAKEEATANRLVETALKWNRRETATAIQFTHYSADLCRWLISTFGHLAHRKTIPGWFLGMPVAMRCELLAGYIAGDGYERDGVVEATTVSKALAFGLRSLLDSLGMTSRVYVRAQADTVIDGRTIHANHPAFSVRCRSVVHPAHRQTAEDELHRWYAVREVRPTGEVKTVHNITVDEDHSYVVEGIVSKNCTHFSVAKGDVPRKQHIRSLAWAVIRWAKEVRPAVIFLENVQEFRGWGPLDATGRPDRARMGETFRRWRRQLERLGYVVDHRVLDASLYGAPTRRRRLFLVARCDGLPIAWPEPTHGPGRLPLHTAAECIDWSLPCPSIFERKRPLAEKTLWRIAQGIRRFVLEAADPFVIRTDMHRSNAGCHYPVGDPLRTITSACGHAVVTPVIAEPGQRHGRGQQSGGSPLSTVMGKDRHAVVAPTLIQTGYGERPGQAARVPGLHKPLGTCVDGQKHALVSAFVHRYFSGPRPVVGSKCGSPLPTVTAWDHNSLAAVALAKFRGTRDDQPGSASVRDPLPTITAGGIHVAEVRAFLTAYYGEDGTSGQAVDRPLRTITARHRLGLVTVAGVDYQIVDIGLRMLEPHELLRAQFGRFAAGYDLSRAPTKAAKVRLIGNSVAPEVAEALVRANVGDASGKERAA